MLVEILGSGCPRCFETERRARRAARLAGVEAEILKVSDPRVLAERRVLATPAVAIDGTVRLRGCLPSVQALVKLLKEHRGAAVAGGAE